VRLLPAVKPALDVLALHADHDLILKSGLRLLRNLSANTDTAVRHGAAVLFSSHKGLMYACSSIVHFMVAKAVAGRLRLCPLCRL
jgi:hypothetical protein